MQFLSQFVRATDDDQDLDQDANLTDARYGGHPEFRGGVVDGMRGFWRMRAGNGQWQFDLHSGVSGPFRWAMPLVGHGLGGSFSV